MCSQRVSNFLANLLMIAPEPRAFFLCAIVHSSQIISLHGCNTLPNPDELEILHVGVSVESKFRGNFKAE